MKTQYYSITSVTAVVLLTLFQHSEADQPNDILPELYCQLRQVAFPKTPLDGEKKVSERFILQMPGLPLNPEDYTYDQGESPPPKIFENMFRLADITPTLNPMRGGDSGDSLTEAYKLALSSMEIRNFDERNAQFGKSYDEVLKALTREVPHPDNKKKAKMLSVYQELQEKYYTLKEEVEDKLEKKKQESKTTVEYDIWFQNHYPSMQMQMENAYMDWIVYGQKEIVESYKAKIDTSSIGQQLQEARVSLRSSGKITSDRSSMAYPVHFTPSDWYKHLIWEQKPLRETYRAKISELEVKIGWLNAIDPEPEGNQATKKKTETTDPKNSDPQSELNKKSNEATGGIKTQVDALKKKASGCLLANEKDCEDYEKTEKQLGTQVENAMEAKINEDLASQILYADETSKSQLKGQIEALKKEKKELQDELKKLKDTGDFEGISEKKASEDGWMEFEFDNIDTEKKVDANMKKFSAELGIKVVPVIPTWSIGGDISASRTSANLEKQLQSSKVKIKAKVMRVNINRPWFKTSLFKSDQLDLMEEKMVSPGPMKEDAFIDEVQKQNPHYIMPEYVNAFLLAKDVELSFDGIKSSIKSKLVRQSANGKLSGHYLFFGASGGVGAEEVKSSVQVKSTVTGLKIRIPGAQLIGYYTKVVPCFPHNSPGCTSRKS